MHSHDIALKHFTILSKVQTTQLQKKKLTQRTKGHGQETKLFVETIENIVETKFVEIYWNCL